MAQSIQRGLTREADFETAKGLLPSDIEMKWGVSASADQIRNLPVIKPVLDGAETLSETVQAVTEVLSLLIDALNVVVDVLGAVVGVAVDLLEGAILAAKEFLELVKGLLAETSVNFMVHAPVESKSRRKPSDLIYDIGMSYLDSKDAKRPIANVGSFGLSITAMFTSPNPDVILSKVNAFKRNFESIGSDITAVTRQYTKSSYKTRQYALEGSSGLAPDWSFKGSLSDVPPIQKGWSENIDNVIKSLASRRSFIVKVNAAINTATQKINRINTQAQSILRAVNALTGLFALGGQGAFAVYGNGTNEDFARAIVNSPNHPDFPRVELNEVNYGNYRPITAPGPQFADSLMFSGAVVLHLQSAVSLQSVDLVKAFAELLVTPKIGGNEAAIFEDGEFTAKPLAQYVKSVTRPLDERVKSMNSEDGYKTPWSGRKDQAPE